MNIQQDSDAQRLKCNARVVSFPLAAVYGVQLIIFFPSFIFFNLCFLVMNLSPGVLRNPLLDCFGVIRIHPYCRVLRDFFVRKSKFEKLFHSM